MEERHSRNLPALTAEQCRQLKEKRVFIAGCGGLGGYLLELLVRIGVGSIRVADKDVFEESNRNRQLLCRPDTLGKAKAEAAKQWAEATDPAVSVEAFPVPIDENNVHSLIAGCDAVLDGLDNIPDRKRLAAACARANIPYIYGAVSGWTAQAAVCLPGDTLLDTLYPDPVQAADKSVLSFTPALCASVQAALCVRLLTGCPAESGKLYHFDLFDREFDTICL